MKNYDWEDEYMESLPITAKHYFRDTVPIIHYAEMQYGMELWEMSGDDFMETELLKKMHATPEKIYRVVSAARKYMEYLQAAHNIDMPPGWTVDIERNYAMTTYKHNSARTEIFAPREQVLTLCRSFINARDAFVVLALYEGLKSVQISELRQEDIQPQGLKIAEKNGALWYCSDELLLYARKAVKETEYIRAIKNSNGVREFAPYKLHSGREIVRFISAFDSAPASPNRVRNIKDILYKGLKGSLAQRVPFHLDESVTSSHFFESGKVQFILEQVLLTHETPLDFVHSESGREELKEQFGPCSYQILHRLVRRYDWIFNENAPVCPAAS